MPNFAENNPVKEIQPFAADHKVVTYYFATLMPNSEFEKNPMKQVAAPEIGEHLEWM